MAPAVFYLHGFGGDDHRGLWRDALDAAFVRLDAARTDLRALAGLAPSYSDLLTGDLLRGDRLADPTHVPTPVRTHRPLTGDALRAAEGRYLRRLARLGRELHDDPVVRHEPLPSVPAVVVDEIMERRFAAVDRYRKNDSLRRAVLNRVLAQLPSHGDIVLIGHSLGSVVALDLLYYLPPALDVRLLLTLGSPLSLRALHGHLERVRSGFPFDRVGGWVNIVGRWDPVTGGRGAAEWFPEALDVVVDTGRVWEDPHAARRYLDQDVVAAAVRIAVDDEQRDGAAPARLPQRPVDDDVLVALARMQFALRLEQALASGERRTRVAQARALVADELAHAHPSVGDPGGGLDGDPDGDPDGDHATLLHGRWHPREGLAVALALAAANPLAPYEIDIDRDARRKAVVLLAADLGLPASWGHVVSDALQEAREDHNGRSWRWAVLAVGAVAMVAAPYAVLAAAPAQLAGAAAITAGLAALGPGGMLGGLGVVGMIGGAGGVAAAAALQAGSPAAVAEWVVAVQALALARKRLQLREPGSPEWHLLVTTEARLAAEHRRYERVSDKGSAQLRATEHKLKTVRAAIEWMREKQLGPLELAPAVPAQRVPPS